MRLQPCLLCLPLVHLACFRSGRPVIVKREHHVLMLRKRQGFEGTQNSAFEDCLNVQHHAPIVPEWNLTASYNQGNGAFRNSCAFARNPPARRYQMRLRSARWCIRSTVSVGRQGAYDRVVPGFFAVIGDKVASEILFVCSDTWKPYLDVIAEKSVNALNILDRFHFMAK